MNRSLLTLSLATLTTLSLAGCSILGIGADKEAGSENMMELLRNSPISKYLEPITSGMNLSQSELDEQMKQAEEIVAACMKEQGFEYTPTQYGRGGVVIGDDGPYKDYGTRTFAETYGYGVTTIDPTTFGDEGNVELEDPNAAYVESLSDSERDAYYEALYGSMSDPAPIPEDEGDTTDETTSGSSSGPAFSYDWEKAGCRGKADHETIDKTSGGDVYSDPKYSKLFEEISELYTKTEEDSTYLAAIDNWSNCMADANYPGYKNPQDPINAISEEYSQLFGGPGPSTGGETEDIETPTAPSPDPSKLAALREKEIKIAVADFDCQQTTKVQSIRAKAQYALEKEFIQNHRDELDSMLAEYAKTEK